MVFDIKPDDSKQVVANYYIHTAPNRQLADAFFVAERRYDVKAVTLWYGTAGAAVTVDVRIVGPTVANAEAAGTSVLSAEFTDVSANALTHRVGSLSTTAGALRMDVGDRLMIDSSATVDAAMAAILVTVILEQV